jgi:hypothetical protein
VEAAKRVVERSLKIEHSVTTFSPGCWFKRRDRHLRNELAAPGRGGASTMDQPEALQRLNAALDELEGHLKDVGEEDGDASIAALREQIRFLTDERDQLLVDLEAERSRVRRLKAANDEVSGRLDVVMGTLKDIMPAMPS